MKTKIRLFCSLILPFLLAACTVTPAANNDEFIVPMAAINTTDLPTLADAIAQEPDMALWFTALNRIGMITTLQESNGVTLLAPTNSAFAANQITSSQINDSTLQQIAQLHILNQAMSIEQLRAAQTVATSHGSILQVNQIENTLLIDYIELNPIPIQTQNGLVYFVDGLLLSEDNGSIWSKLATDERLSTFANLLRGTPLMYGLSLNRGPDALLAPTNEAFAAMPPHVLDAIQSDYHFLEFWMGLVMLTPDGWPEGKPLTLPEIAAMETIKSSLPVSGSGFGFGYEQYAITISEESLSIGEMRVLEEAFEATNGTVLIVDTAPVSQRILDSLLPHDD
jgi:uncharacterized surface protein with fasciclin (FAS1) repeats